MFTLETFKHNAMLLRRGDANIFPPIAAHVKQCPLPALRGQLMAVTKATDTANEASCETEPCPHSAYTNNNVKSTMAPIKCVMALEINRGTVTDLIVQYLN